MKWISSLVSSRLNYVKKGPSWIKDAVLLTFISSVLVSTYFTFNSINQYSASQGGMEICFNRIRQSFTAQMIKDSSGPFLSNNFLQNTEQCLSDVQNNLGQVLSFFIPKGQKALMESMIKDTFWFHKNIKNRFNETKDLASPGENPIVKTLNSFKKLENTYFDLQATSSSNLQYQKGFFQIVFSLLVLSIGLYYLFKFFQLRDLENQIDLKNNQDSNQLGDMANQAIPLETNSDLAFGVNKLEETANNFDQRKNYQQEHFEQILQLINSSFNVPKLTIYFKNLFYHLQMQPSLFEVGQVPVKKESVKNIITVKSHDQNQSEVREVSKQLNHSNPAFDQIEKFVRPFKATHFNEIIPFDKVFDSAQKILSRKAFGHGIIFTNDFEDNINICGEKDGIGQFLFQLIELSINLSLRHNQGRKIDVALKGLGSQVVLSLSLQNFIFGTTELEAFTPKRNDEEIETNKLSAEFRFLKEMCHDLGINIFLRNISSTSQSDSPLGLVGNILIFFAQAPKTLTLNQEKPGLDIAAKDRNNADSREFQKPTGPSLKALFKGKKKNWKKESNL